MSDLEIPEYIEKMAWELGFLISICDGVYFVENEKAMCRSPDIVSIGVYLAGFRDGQESCNFTEEWAQRDMG